MSTRGLSIAPRTAIVPSPPASANAMSSPESGQSPGAMPIMTSRAWVLPPRPKPGRKPSVDTPASKRKAQNRAAQRAFRERRATRVQELEEKLMEVEKDKEAKEMGLVSTINKLKFENQFLLKSLDQLRSEVAALRTSVGASPGAASPAYYRHGASPHGGDAAPPAAAAAHKADLAQSAQQLLHFAKSIPTTSTCSPASSHYSVQQISPAPSADSPPGARAGDGRGKDGDYDCGVCLKEQCLCEDVGLKDASLEESLRAFAPMPAVALRGKRKAAPPTETDFTSEFAVKKMPDLKRLRKDSVAVKKELGDTLGFNEDSPVENCGFCSDDTPCVCREAAKEAARINQSLAQKHKDDEELDEDTSLPPIQARGPMVRKTSLPVMHPGPSLEIREFTNAVPATVQTPEPQPQQPDDKADGCTGNPGTCSQCQTDPMSTLFCSTVASKAASQKTDEPSPLVAPRLSDSRRGSSISADRKPPGSTPSTPGAGTPAANGIFIPCADAYRTLSRHKSFNSVDFSSLVGRLTTRGMLVEAHSVAKLIRELDKKVFD